MVALISIHSMLKVLPNMQSGVIFNIELNYLPAYKFVDLHQDVS